MRKRRRSGDLVAVAITLLLSVTWSIVSCEGATHTASAPTSAPNATSKLSGGATSHANASLVKAISSARPGKDVLLPAQLPDGWYVATAEETKRLYPAWADLFATNPMVRESATFYYVMYTDGTNACLLGGDIDLDGGWELANAGIAFEGEPWYQFYQDGATGLQWSREANGRFESMLLEVKAGKVPDETLLSIAGTIKRYRTAA